MSFDSNRFAEVCELIEPVFKHIERKNASKNPNIVREREQSLVERYNEVITVGSDVYENGTDSEIQDVKATTIDIRDRTLHCLGILQSKLKVPTDLSQTIEDNFYDDSDENKDNPARSGTHTQAHGTDSKHKHRTDDTHAHSTHKPAHNDKHSELHSATKSDQKNVPISSHTPNVNNVNTMADLDFLQKIASVMKKDYSGEPDGLRAFIEQIELVDLGTPDDKKDTLIKFIKSKLIGRAKEAVPDATNTVEAIKTALKAKIKPENSDVVLGRLLALKADRNSLQNFQKLAEELSEKLRIAYVDDGIPPDVAKKMVVAKTVEMCKSTARNEYVKTVIAATHFDEPKDVLAKYVVETTSEKDKKEAQVLNFSSRGRNGHVRGRGRGQNGNFRQNNGRFGNNGQYQNRQNYNNNYNNGQYRNNWNQNGRGYGNNWNYNGRGRGRGGHQQNDNRFVRMIAPGNEQGPAAEGNALTLQQANQQ